MRNIVLWGTGQYAERLEKVIQDNIVLVVDNNSRLWGTKWKGHFVHNPIDIKNVIAQIDKIIVASSYWDDIEVQLVEEYGIDISKIDNVRYRQKELLLQQDVDNSDVEKQRCIEYLKTHPMSFFNDKFVEKYNKMEIEVRYDEEKGLYYVIHSGKRMYFSKKYDSEKKVSKYYKGLLLEQDIDSPHRYLTEDFKVNLGDVVLDAGVAEGNFALEIIDYVKKIYLVESDREWIEALQYTFEPYKDKVEIIEGFLGNSIDEIKIDQILKGRRIDFIKMDIEGAEVSALKGGRQTLCCNDVYLDICVYHNVDDEEKVRNILNEYGYQVQTSKGYMIYPKDVWWEEKIRCPQLVRGLLRGKMNM